MGDDELRLLHRVRLDLQLRRERLHRMGHDVRGVEATVGVVGPQRQPVVTVDGVLKYQPYWLFVANAAPCSVRRMMTRLGEVGVNVVFVGGVVPAWSIEVTDDVWSVSSAPKKKRLQSGAAWLTTAVDQAIKTDSTRLPGPAS